MSVASHGDHDRPKSPKTRLPGSGHQPTPDSGGRGEPTEGGGGCTRFKPRNTGPEASKPQGINRRGSSTRARSNGISPKAARGLKQGQERGADLGGVVIVTPRGVRACLAGLSGPWAVRGGGGVGFGRPGGPRGVLAAVQVRLCLTWAGVVAYFQGAGDS